MSAALLRRHRPSDLRDGCCAAMGQPELLAEDIGAFFGPLRWKRVGSSWRRRFFCLYAGPSGTGP